jgi:antirestriction protein ArdC
MGGQVRRGEKASPIVFWKKIQKTITDEVSGETRIGTFPIANTLAEIRYGGERAYYNVTGDYIHMPLMERFTGTDTSTPRKLFTGRPCMS